MLHRIGNTLFYVLYIPIASGKTGRVGNILFYVRQDREYIILCAIPITSADIGRVGNTLFYVRQQGLWNILFYVLYPLHLEKQEGVENMLFYVRQQRLGNTLFRVHIILFILPDVLEIVV